jgi:NADH:ubiquinone reductase (non-electrogenic)
VLTYSLGIESATFAGQPEEEVERLLHMVVVGGGPTGVEYAAELHDFISEDLVSQFDVDRYTYLQFILL